jgi:hypothetical protein
MNGQYQHPQSVVKPARRVSGNYLAFNHLSLVECAFLAADLVSGARFLTAPTQKQAAGLARVSSCYVFWAIKRQDERRKIEAGLAPLVPPPDVISKTNGIGDAELVQLVRNIGVNRVLEAACTAETTH